MNTATRLGLYGAVLAVVFSGAYGTADAVVPQSAVKDWMQQAKGHQTSMDNNPGHAQQGHHTGQGIADMSQTLGVTSAQDGYLLTPVTAPGEVGKKGTLSFRILDAAGKPVTRYATEHDEDLHLIVVRTDGTHFRHVHPRLAADGTWSLPWSWAAAGTYRVYADFIPAAQTGAGTGDESITLTRTVEVAGAFAPVNLAPADTASVDGFTVKLTGDLTTGSTAQLTLSVTTDGKPVTTLQPYLGAFGHLVALREGDLAYLHIHPQGREPAPGATSGPDIKFMAEVPTPGRYLLYLDFQVDGQVRCAPFVVDAARGTGHTTAPDGSTSDMGSSSGSDSQSGTESGHNH